MEASIQGQPPSQITGELVSGSYFAALGVDPLLGRTLIQEDDRAPESSPVAVISYGLWKRAFGGAPDVLGKTISVRSSPGSAGTGGLNIYDGAAARLVLKNGMRLALLGVALGLAGAAAMTQLIKSQLHGINAIEPLTFVVVALGLIGVTVFACWLPARRAANLDPMNALRHE